MRYCFLMGSLILLLLAACGVESTPTLIPSPQLPSEVTQRSEPEFLRMDLGNGVVASFVEGLLPDSPGKVAYVTHVPSGSQVVLDRGGQVIERHDGRDDGPAMLEAVLADEAAMERIMAVLRRERDALRRLSSADWVHSIRFASIFYRAKGFPGEPVTVEGERGLTVEDLGPEFYRIAFRLDGHPGPGGSRTQEGGASFLDPGTPVYTVKGYVPEFRLATVSDGRVIIYEADTNPAAKVGADLLDIRNRVSSIGIHSTQSGSPELASIGDPEMVEWMVETVLSAPVDQDRRDRDGDRYYIAFQLEDGTAVVRHFWLESGELSRGIMTPESFRVSVLQAFSESGAVPPTEGPPTPAADFTSTLGSKFFLTAGQTVFVKSENLLVRFLSVVEDSRCPTRATCGQAGRATILVNITKNGHGLGDYELTLEDGNEDLAIRTFGGYSIRLASIDYVRTGGGTGEQVHGAMLVVSVAERLISANTEFGFNLLAELLKQGPGENIFVSPLSVSTALAMTYNGAAGDTQQAMAQTLRLEGMDLGEVNRGSAALFRSLGGLNPEVELNIANSLWARQGVEFRPDFLQRNREHFGAEIASLDFNGPKARQTINEWVDTSTKGKIKKIIEQINPNDQMFLINAIYFNGTWLFPFDKEKTTERAFHLPDGTQKQHPMMSQSGKYLYLKGGNFQAVKLPYRKTRVSMYVFLPGPDSSLEEFLSGLNAQDWETWMSQFKEGGGDIVLPRFKLEYESMLNDALTALGMGIAFGGSADFSAMSPVSGLYIDRVKHKAVVDVNEEGTEAAAATSVVMAVSGPLFTFDLVVDRPFFFTIRDENTGTVLFMGAVFEPEE